ncbi:MAG: ABC transporter permease [bacterium]
MTNVVHSLGSAVTWLNSPKGFLALMGALVAVLVLLGLFTSTMTIAWRELKRYFRSPASYLVLAMFLLYQGVVFFMLISLLNGPNADPSPPMRWFFGGVIWFYPVFVFVVAMLTCSLLTSEQRERTIETLMTAPVRESEVVLGKFLGTMGFFVFMWLWTLVYIIILSNVGAGQKINPGPVLSGYVGTLLICALGVSFGLLCSALTRDLLLALMATVIGLKLVFIVKLMMVFGVLKTPGDKPGRFMGLISSDWINRVFEHTMIIDFMDDFSQGIVDSRNVIYLLSATALFLFAAVRVLQLRKWR